MKTTPFLLLTFAAGAVGQSVFTYRDQTNGGLVLRARSGLFTSQPGPQYVFDLAGDVSVDSSAQNLRFVSSRAHLVAVPEPGHSNRNRVKTATADGAVRVTKTDPSGRTALLNGSRAVYEANGSRGTIAMGGPVQITMLDAPKHQTWVATGASGSADLIQGGTSPLRSASLTGGVHITLRQSGAKPGTVTATGSRLLYQTSGSGATVTLSGSVSMRGNELGSFGVLQGGSRIVLTLNARNEVEKYQVLSG